MANLSEMEICPSTGETCVFVRDAKVLFTGNHNLVEHDVSTEDQNHYTSVILDHAALLEDKGDITGPVGNKCPLYEHPEGKQAVRHIIGGSVSRPHSI